MKDNHNSNNDNNLTILLDKYRSLRAGKAFHYLEEEDYELLINYYLDRDQVHKAIEAADYGLNQFPNAVVLLLKKADLLIDGLRYDEALQLIEKAEIFDNNNILIYILKSDLYLVNNQYDKALELLTEAKEKFLGKEKIELLFELTDIYDDYGHFHLLFDCLVDILKIDPQNEEALYKICFWAETLNKNEESVALHLDIIEKNPYSELAWFNLASAYQSLKLYEKAIDAYGYAIAIDDDFDIAYRNTADAYIKLRKYHDAIENLLTVLKLDDKDEIIYEALGHCYEKIKDYDNARNYYFKALNLVEAPDRIMFKMCRTYMIQGDWKSAINMLTPALHIAPKNAEYNYTLAVSHFQLDHFEDTIHFVTLSIQTKPKKIKAWELLLTALYLLEMHEEGLQTLDYAFDEFDATKPILQYYHALFLFGQKKIKACMQVLDHAIATNPKHLKVLLDLEPSLLQNAAIAKLIAQHKKK